MKLFMFGLSMAVLNIVCFLLIDSAFSYINLVIGCLCFFCAGMNLQEIADKIKDKNNH